MHESAVRLAWKRVLQWGGGYRLSPLSAQDVRPRSLLFSHIVDIVWGERQGENGGAWSEVGRPSSERWTRLLGESWQCNRDRTPGQYSTCSFPRLIAHDWHKDQVLDVIGKNQHLRKEGLM